MQNATNMLELESTLLLPTVSRVKNVFGVITTTAAKSVSSNQGERYSIVYYPQAKEPYGVYKETLKWNNSTWEWEHLAFSEGTFRLTYRAAFNNLQDRFINRPALLTGSIFRNEK